MGWAGLGWAGLGRAGLGWAGLGKGRLPATCPSCTSCIRRSFASLCRCIAAPPSVFCRYILILSLNLMASGRLSGWLA
ncbi:hypothetical protein V8C86DRAFT_2988804, partial [Haematococcus lacustris]